MSHTAPSHEIPILITSSVVAHDTGVRLRNTDDRIRLAMEGIGEWLRIYPKSPLVLCDGSSFDFTELVHQTFPHEKIECLPFENDQQRVLDFGRSYGEGEIVRFALNNSRFIAEAGCFAKCSSKLWVENFEECISEWNGRLLLKGVFMNIFSPFRKTVFSYVDTRFYVVNTGLYRQFFENAHLQVSLRKGKGYSLEDSFRDILLEQNIERSLLRVAPVICGVGGGTGKYYKNTPTRRFKERLRVRLAAMHPAYHQLFV